MKQELRDSIVHTLATMILDNADNPRFQDKCRLAIVEAITNKLTSGVHSALCQCMPAITNYDDVVEIAALISEVRLNGRQ